MSEAAVLGRATISTLLLLLLRIVWLAVCWRWRSSVPGGLAYSSQHLSHTVQSLVHQHACRETHHMVLVRMLLDLVLVRTAGSGHNRHNFAEGTGCSSAGRRSRLDCMGRTSRKVIVSRLMGFSR